MLNKVLNKYISIINIIITSNSLYKTQIKDQQIHALPFNQVNVTAQKYNLLLNNIFNYFERAIQNLTLYNLIGNYVKNTYDNLFMLSETEGILVGDTGNIFDSLVDLNLTTLFTSIHSSIVFLKSIPYQKDRNSVEVLDLRESLAKKIDFLSFEFSEMEFYRKMNTIIEQKSKPMYDGMIKNLRKLIS